MKIKMFSMVLLVLSSCFTNAQAAVISVDTLPGLPTIEGSRNIMTSTPFSVDILITDVADFSGFEFDLFFDSSILKALSITSGDIFGTDTFGLENSVNSSSVRLSEFSTAIDEGINITTANVLASVSFEVVGFGISALTLNNIILSDSLGSEITANTLQNGQIDSKVTIPDPNPLFLFMMSFLAIFFWAQKNTAYKSL
ncbi:MAG: hypothetical protein GQ583_12570 [Methyloprofundus sp.]|nr:hypothetical protein [Methyloprofundus sp.]